MCVNNPAQLSRQLNYKNRKFERSGTEDAEATNVEKKREWSLFLSDWRYLFCLFAAFFIDFKCLTHLFFLLPLCDLLLISAGMFSAACEGGKTGRDSRGLKFKH